MRGIRDDVVLEENDMESIEELMKYLNQDTSLESGVFADYWAQNCKNLALMVGCTFSTKLLIATCSLIFQSLTFWTKQMH